MANVFCGGSAYVAFQVRVCPELKEKLKRQSFETGVSQRAIVTEALNFYLKSNLVQMPQRNHVR